MDDTNPLPDYYLLLSNASQASEAVDMFDLDSSNPESTEKFQRLSADSDQAQRELIDFIAANEKALRQSCFGGPTANGLS